jgi:large subunit ribosomal protein L21
MATLDQVSSLLAPRGAENFMYAIVKTGGKQYKAEQGDILIVDKISGEPGVALDLSDVLAVVDGGNTTVGAPFIAGASVKAEIVRQVKSKKINAFNYKAKKNERKRWGHRQEMTHVRVTSVEKGS